MSSPNPVRLEIHESVAQIIFDQPNSRANVMSAEVRSALANAIDQVAERDDLVGLLLSSAKDGMFVAGADLKELAALPTDDPQPAQQFVAESLAVLAKLESLTIPTAAAIDGACLGGGFELALACDYRLAGTHTKLKIGLPEVKLNLIPGWGGTQRLPRVIGVKHAAELIVSGKPLPGPEALALGMVDRIVESTALVATARDVLINAPDEDWESRRARKQSPYSEPIDLKPASAVVATLSDDERAAAEAVVRSMEKGLPLPLTPALACESAEFVPLLLGAASRKRIAAFLQR